MRTGQWSVEHRLQHCLNFSPDPQGQGAFRSTFPLWCVNCCGKACNGVPQRGEIGDQVDPPSFAVETPFHRATPFHQATTERPAGLICGEKIGLARRRLPLTAVPSRSGSEMSAEYGTPLYAD